MLIRPYGDTENDGAVQLSFTLPIECGTKAAEVARLYVLKLGFQRCQIVSAARLKDGFTMFVAYAYTNVGIDPDTIEVDQSAEEDCMSIDETDAFIRQHVGRKIVVVGACIGSDAHTVGIDAIMNMKGFHGHYGLERYAMIEAHNLGAQVPAEALIDRAVEVAADAILVARTVTQKDSHIRVLGEFLARIESSGLGGRFLLIAGGPRTSHALARELGFDAGFSVGSHAGHVATFVARRLAERLVPAAK